MKVKRYSLGEYEVTTDNGSMFEVSKTYSSNKERAWMVEQYVQRSELTRAYRTGRKYFRYFKDAKQHIANEVEKWKTYS